MGLQNLESSNALGCLQHPVTQLAQDSAGMRSDIAVVFDGENRLVMAALGDSRRRFDGRDRFIRIQARQINLHRRALTDFAINSYMAAGLLDEAIDLRQAQTGSMTDILGGEERL